MYSTLATAARRCRLLWVGALLALAGLNPACDREPPAARNLVIICIDTLRMDRLERFGGERITTPELSRLMDAGTTWSQAQSTSNWTVPAVGSLLTGRLPAAHGAIVPGDRKNLGVEPKTPNVLDPSVPLLSEILQGRGVHTALFSGNPYLYGRFQAGFDVVRVAKEDGDRQLPEILSWIDRVSPDRFFLYWQIMDLHQPIDPPAEDARRFLPEPPPDFPSARYAGWSWGNLAPETANDPEFARYRSVKLALYDGALHHVDDLIAGLVGRLRDRGLADGTLIVVTADHGEEFWDHALAQRASGDPRGIWGIGHGHTMYQELLRVPLLLVGPGVPRGRAVDCPASLADVLPTVLTRLGVAMPTALEGRDLSPALGATPPDCADRLLVSDSPAWGADSAAIRAGRWKLVWRKGEPLALFDLQLDPEERRSLADARPELAEDLAARLREARAKTTTTRAAEVNAELRAKLQTLGYVP